MYTVHRSCCVWQEGGNGFRCRKLLLVMLFSRCTRVHEHVGVAHSLMCHGQWQHRMRSQLRIVLFCSYSQVCCAWCSCAAARGM
jgi:hypothetical protein